MFVCLGGVYYGSCFMSDVGVVDVLVVFYV